MVVVCAANSEEENAMSILDELWVSNISPDGQTYYLREEIRSATQQLVDAENALGKLLSPEAETAFEEYQRLQQELAALTDHATFTRGFRLGAGIMLEALKE